MSCMGNSDRRAFGRNVRQLREILRLSQEGLAVAAGLDRSYIGGIERGERNPSLTAILQLAAALEVPPARLFESLGDKSPVVPDEMNRLRVAESEEGLAIRFRYDRYDAKYLLPSATRSQYNKVVAVLRRGLVEDGRSRDAVANAFIQATRLWPDINPSDLWTFLINRAYCDRSNHPEVNERLNLEQSWKRTSGWALERVLIEHYGLFLRRNGVIMTIGNKAKKESLLSVAGDSRIVPDKADILISYADSGENLLGVVHVKASIAERRTDDVPMSQALMEAGYLSVFWTMDCKSFPSAKPENRGEFGEASGERISEKRRDFEEHGHFSSCFSYNSNTRPTLEGDRAAKIFVCDFKNPDDHFARFLIDARFQRLRRSN